MHEDNELFRRGPVALGLTLIAIVVGCAAGAPAHDGPGWGYDCAGGPPFLWGTLAPAFVLCGEGDAQSPIDVSTAGSVRDPLPPFALAYGKADVEVVHNGHTIEVEVPEGAASLRLGDQTYRLVQFHWHTPSEHWLDGDRYPMELHMVHAGEAGRLVLGALVTEGDPNEELARIWAVLPRRAGDHAEVAGFDLARLVPADLRSYRYAGSLTTPPCDQGIQWILLAEPVSLSAGQIGAFRALFFGTESFPVGNARPLQPRNGRTVRTDAGGD